MKRLLAFLFTNRWRGAASLAKANKALSLGTGDALAVSTVPYLFHGGCHDCTQQMLHGTNFCFDCCYFNADWSKPSLNNSAPSRADIERKRVIAARKYGDCKTLCLPSD
ncbi:MAG: hypothetical protein ACK459_04190 [Akkermansiaceae bacterium]|jgi:hypothetical protein